MSGVRYNEQWPQELIDRLIPLRDKVDMLACVIHARDYVRSNYHGLAAINANEMFTDGIQNILDPAATGLEWWTLRHRLTDQEIQNGSWLRIKTSWITAREAEEKRNGKQR